MWHTNDDIHRGAMNLLAHQRQTTLESVLDQVIPEGTLCVSWVQAEGTNSDLFTHAEMVAALTNGAFAGCTNVRFEVVPDEQEQLPTYEQASQPTNDPRFCTWLNNPENW